LDAYEAKDEETRAGFTGMGAFAGYESFVEWIVQCTAVVSEDYGGLLK
jgi:hypothetical protein